MFYPNLIHAGVRIHISKDILTAISFVTSVVAVDIAVAEEVLIDTDTIVA